MSHESRVVTLRDHAWALLRRQSGGCDDSWIKYGRVQKRAASNCESNRINREHRNSKGTEGVPAREATSTAAYKVAGVNLVSSLRLDLSKGTTEKVRSFGKVRIFLAASIPRWAKRQNFPTMTSPTAINGMNKVVVPQRRIFRDAAGLKICARWQKNKSIGIQSKSARNTHFRVFADLRD